MYNIITIWLIVKFVTMVSICKKINQQKSRISQLDKTLDDFVTGNSVNVSVS